MLQVEPGHPTLYCHGHEKKKKKADLGCHSIPPNLRFYIDDVERPWTFSQAFDFIHCRMLIGGIKNWPKLFASCFENMAPGGWIEVADFVFPATSDDGTLCEDSALAKWCQYVLECSRTLGAPLEQARVCGAELRAAGFTNIVERHYKWPHNTWARSKKYKDLGTWLFDLDKNTSPLPYAGSGDTC